MPYTSKSLAFVWVMTLGLVVLTGSGAVAGPWLVLLVAIALAAPALILSGPRPIAVTPPSPERTAMVSDDRARSPLDIGNVDVYEWENEGGAGLVHVSGGIRAPVPAAP